MKVLWFSNTPALGSEYLNINSAIKGTGGWIHALNKAIQEEVKLSVAFHYPYAVPKFTFYKTDYHPIYTGNIIIQNFKKRFLGKVYDQDFLENYLKIIEEVKPDVIHIHGTENSFLCILEKTRIPIVISIQGNLNAIHHKFISGFHGKYLKVINEKITVKSLVFGRNNFKKGYLNMQKMAVLEKNHLRYSQHIIGRTDWDKRITRILAPDSRYFQGNELLRNGFYEKHWNNEFTTGKIVLFTTSGDRYYKGFETICQALTLLNELGLAVEWRVAGVSESSLITKITKKHLGKIYPTKGLVLLGALEEFELINNLQQAHLYIMASHIENSPNNLCEAMILGMPCVATFAGGTSSMLKDGEEGILIQDGDPWAMAGAILEMRSSSEFAVSMGIKARLSALKRHCKDDIVSQLLDIYQIVIKQHSHDGFL
jgi:glycosyltransferase involved in cell wall biosynthesis